MLDTIKEVNGVVSLNSSQMSYLWDKYKELGGSLENSPSPYGFEADKWLEVYSFVIEKCKKEEHEKSDKRDSKEPKARYDKDLAGKGIESDE